MAFGKSHISGAFLFELLLLSDNISHILWVFYSLHLYLQTATTSLKYTKERTKDKIKKRDRNKQEEAEKEEEEFLKWRNQGEKEGSRIWMREYN